MYMKKWRMRVVPLLLALVLAAGLLPVRAWAADVEYYVYVTHEYYTNEELTYNGKTETSEICDGSIKQRYGPYSTNDNCHITPEFSYGENNDYVIESPNPFTESITIDGEDVYLTITYKRYVQSSFSWAAPEPTPEPPPPDNPDPEPVIDPDPVPDPAPDPDDPAPVAPEPSTSQPVDGDSTELPPGEDLLPPPEEIPVSPIQDAVKDEKEIVPWIERIEAPEYAGSLYEVLSGGSDPENKEIPSYLIDDSYFTLSDGGADVPGQTVVDVEGVDFDLADLYAGGDVSLGTAAFENEDFYQVSGKGAGQVDYAKLKEGDAVKASTFNGIFITSIPRDDRYDEAKKEAVAYVSTVFQAFDRDHPEVFWLTGKCKMRIPTVRQADGVQRAYFFLVLAEEDYTMRSPAWTEPGAVEQGIQRRDKAVTEILAAVTAATPAEQVRQLNRWLTEHNQYNTTPDLTTIGNEPHECLAALEGRIDRDGPVCDGYSRAFKVLCDKLDIPCVLENGYAKTGPESEGTFHMWNAVKIDGQWYGVDVTWNDPTVKGFVGAKSGKENEQFLLVGLNTMVRGLAFGVSHPVLNKAAINGVAFNNGPSLNPVALSAMPDSPDSSALPFTDVAKGVWYYDNVAYVYGKNLMRGTTGDKFSPTGPTTRQQLWMILARIDGANPKDMDAARAWAVDSNVSDGSNPGGQLTREQLVTMLYRFCQSRGQDVSGRAPLTGFADAGDVSAYAQDALAWAVSAKVITGSDGKILPKDIAKRAQMAAILQRFQQAQ